MQVCKLRDSGQGESIQSSSLESGLQEGRHSYLIQCTGPGSYQEVRFLQPARSYEPKGEISQETWCAIHLVLSLVVARSWRGHHKLVHYAEVRRDGMLQCQSWWHDMMMASPGVLSMWAPPSTSWFASLFLVARVAVWSHCGSQDI